jgi:hypothetical protein
MRIIIRVNTNRWKIGLRTGDGCSWLGSCSVAEYGVVGVEATCDTGIERGIYLCVSFIMILCNEEK